MRLVRSSLAVFAVVSATFLFTSPVSAQVDTTTAAPKPAPAPAPAPAPMPEGITHLSGGYLVGSFPTGDWGKIAGFGLALDGADVVKKPGKKIGLRSSLGVLYNFSRTVDVPSANLAANDNLSIETKNWSLFFGLGPEFSMPNRNMTPFVFGTVGFDTYWTSSQLAGTANGSSYSAEHGDSRLAFAWAAGVGFRRQAGAGFQMELSAEYRSGSDHQYLRPEDVTSGAGGVVANRTGHTSDQFIVRFGTVLGGAGY